MNLPFKNIIISVLVTILSVGILVIIRRLFFKILQKWADKTQTNIDDIIMKVIRLPSFYWAIAIGLYIGVATSDLKEKYVIYITKSIYVIVILSIAVVCANLVVKTFSYYIKRHEVPIPTTGLAYGVIKGTILLMGFLLALSAIGISITPFITALGVSGLAVALALQDTLSNLFAGLHILMEKSIRVGDFIRLESGQEGYVEDITWRTTRVRMLPNNMVIIPNSKLSQSIVTNYYLPEKRMSLLIPINVSYSSDPQKVEDILIDETKKAAGEIPGLLTEPAPFVRFIPGFGESSLDFTLICQVKEFVDQYYVQHELRKRIFKRFQSEGIEIPFPHRTIYLREEKDWAK